MSTVYSWNRKVTYIVCIASDWQYHERSRKKLILRNCFVQNECMKGLQVYKVNKERE